VMLSVRAIFSLWTWRTQTYEGRDARFALYAPLSLLVLPMVWLVAIGLGYTAMYGALGNLNAYQVIELSGSSMFPLRFAVAPSPAMLVLTFSQAAIGLMLVALFIAYLPAMYGAFSKREALVTMLEVRAGSPPSPVELIERYHRLGRFDHL